MLSKLHADFLPEAIDGWTSMSDDSKEQLTTMYNYYCKLHLLINFETAVSSTAHEMEKHVTSGKNPHAFLSEPCGAKRLCKNSSKGLTMTGSDQSGVGNLWHAYLDGIGEDNHLINIEHDRLNTLFHQAAAVFHHQHHIRDFLSSLPDPNNLLKTLIFDLDEKAYIAGVRALGILDKIMTGPYWRMLENAENILSINTDLENLRQHLETWGADSSALLAGDIVLFPQVGLRKDDLYTSLFTDSNDVLLDTYTQMFLELMCQATLLVLERQAKDQLKGGKFCEPSDKVVQRSRAVPTTNMVSERDFGQLDHLNKMKPAASITCYEAIILWTNNETAQWLQRLPDKDRSELLEEARKSGPSLYQKFKEKQERLMQERQHILKDKQEKTALRAENEIRKRADVTSELEYYGGLWRDTDTVSTYLQGRASKEKVKALHAQIAFHRDVLKSKGKKELFQKSTKGKIYNAQELERNLCIIITSNNIQPEEGATKNLEYRGVTEIKELVAQSKKKNLLKLRKQRIRIKVQEQRDKLTLFETDPALLVGCRVKHNVRECAGEESQWLDALVTDIVEQTGDNMTTIYSIKYDDVPEEYNQFPLLKDMKNGDLILVEAQD